MKRRLSPSDAVGGDGANDTLPPSAGGALPVPSEQLAELVQAVLSRDVLSSLLSQAALSLAPKRFGHVVFGAGDETNVNAFLHQKLGKDNLSRRAGPRGTKLTYIESCKAIELANQAFGFNGWSCHILECKEEYRQNKNERWSIGFSCLVRIELKDGTSHEDVGFGQADGQPHLGAAIEQAKKASISDARKRALRLFGEYLGNSCYDREHIKDVHSNKPTPQPVAIPAPGSRSLGQNMKPPMGTFGGPSPGSGNAAPFVNLPPQVPAQSAQPQAQQYQQRPPQPAVATPSPPQPNAANVASRISALQTAETSRQATVMTSGVGLINGQGGPHGVMRRAPPMPQLTHAQQTTSTMGSSVVTRPNQMNAASTAAPPQHAPVSAPQPAMPHQQRHSNLPPQPFMPRNAPPPSRMVEYPVIKNEPPPARAMTSEFDMNDLSLSQFDFDPSDGGPPGAAKRMRS